MGRSAVLVEPTVGLDPTELTLRLRGIAAACTVRDVAAAAVQTVRWAIGTDVGWCGLTVNDTLEMVAHQGMRNPDIAELWRLPLGQGIGGRVATEGRPLVVRDYARDPRRVPVLKELIDAEELRSSICVPLMAEDNVLGVLYVSERTLRSFLQDEIDLMLAVAGVAGTVLADRLAQPALQRAAAERTHRIVSLERSLRTLVEVADAGASCELPASGVAVAVRRLARELGAEVRMLDEHGNLQAEAGDVRGDELAAVALEAGEACIGGLAVTTLMPLDEGETELLRLTARVLTLLSLRQRTAAETEMRLSSEFLDDLLSGAAGADEAGFLRRAAMLGLDLHSSAVVVCVGVHRSGTEVADRSTSPQRQLRERVERVARRTFEHVVVAQRPNEIVLILHAPSPDEAALRDVVRSMLAAVSDGEQPSAGIGRPCTRLVDYAASFSEASMCLRLAIARGEVGTVLCPAELGLYALFGHQATRQALSAVVAETLGPLMEADRRAHSEYVKTLGVYLSHDRHLETSSKALHVHVNTLRYRLSKIQSITGIDLRHVDSRFLLELAVRVHQAIGE